MCTNYLQKGMIVVAKTATASRMIENRGIQQFALTAEEMQILDGITTAEDVQKRELLEQERKLHM
jgi:diketogulonate reductase-like aldo/keto reductase